MYDNWQIKNTFTKIMKKLDEDRPLRNILIVIFFVIGFYYFASPYENCIRDFEPDGYSKKQPTRADIENWYKWHVTRCADRHNW